MRVVMALWYRHVKLFFRNRTQLVLILVMPFFYLYLISTIFESVFITNPKNYVLAGIIMIVIFQTSLNVASSTIEDIVSGYMKEVLVSPVKRIHLAFGQILASATIATFQGMIILCIGLFIGMKPNDSMTPIYSILMMVFAGLVFATFGLLLATLIKNSQTFQIVSTAVTTPITFLCGVYVPLSLLPNGLQQLALLNPMTYAAAFFRTLTLEKTSLTAEELLVEQLAFKIGSFIITPQISFILFLVFGLFCFLLSVIAFSNADFSKMNRVKVQKDIFQQ